MRRYLLDSGIVGDFIARRHGVAERVRQARKQGHRIGTAIPVVAELYYGAEYSASRERNMRELNRSLAGIVVWPFDRIAAEEYGRLAAALRRTGRPMQVIDMMIAAIARTLGNCTVVTKDSDFVAVPGLSIEDWSVASPSS
jgi:tRNA(fMet)-specific endonuclease VapC